MALFDVVPAGLFAPLAAPGARVYLEVLLDLHREARRQSEPLSRQLVIDCVYRHLLRSGALEQTGDLAGAEDLEGPDPVLSRATALTRYLTERGWLQVETEADFSSRYILPTYAFRLLTLLEEIADNEPPPLTGLVYTIHSVLQQARREGADFGVSEAARNTQQLLNGLKELQHNIGRHLN